MFRMVAIQLDHSESTAKRPPQQHDSAGWVWSGVVWSGLLRPLLKGKVLVCVCWPAGQLAGGLWLSRTDHVTSTSQGSIQFTRSFLPFVHRHGVDSFSIPFVLLLVVNRTLTAAPLSLSDHHHYDSYHHHQS